jgi:hypothetical protein
MKKYILSIILFVLVVGGLLITVKSSAIAALESANGHGTVLRQDENGKTVRRQFSFHARRNSDGTVTGSAVLHNPAFQGADGNKYQAKLDISCMRIVGNIAYFGGTIKRTNDPNLVDTAFFSVQDNGEPGKDNDRISGLVFYDDDPTANPGNPQLCQILDTNPQLVPVEPIESGNIQVRQ